MEQEIINLRQRVSLIKKICEQMAKQEKCLLCQRETTSFCNSHSIPQFVLKNIAENGQVFTNHVFLDFGIKGMTNIKEGINKAGTFRCICRECDGKIFSDYESPALVSSRSYSSKFLAEIAIKNFLMQLSKRFVEKSIYYSSVQQHDISDYMEYLSCESNIALNLLKKRHRIIYQKKLNYRVPMAAQGTFLVYKDLSGRVVNSIYDNSASLYPIHLCIFPLCNESVILLFINKNAEPAYSGFIKTFDRLRDMEKLHYVLYLAVKYTENLFLSPTISPDILKNQNLQMLAKEVYGVPLLTISPQDRMANSSNIVYSSIPNLLLEKYHL